MVQILLGGFIVGLGLIFITRGLEEKLNLHNYILKSEVVKALAGDWRTHVFSCQNSIQKTASGDTHFYSAKEIDEKIKILNEALKSNDTV